MNSKENNAIVSVLREYYHNNDLTPDSKAVVSCIVDDISYRLRNANRRFNTYTFSKQVKSLPDDTVTLVPLTEGVTPPVQTVTSITQTLQQVNEALRQNENRAVDNYIVQTMQNTSVDLNNEIQAVPPPPTPARARVDMVQPRVSRNRS